MSDPIPDVEKKFLISQEMVDKIVRLANSSEMGLGLPEKGRGSYSLANYSPPDLNSLAIMLVSAHFAKWDIISIVSAALTVVAEEAARRALAEEATKAPPEHDTKNLTGLQGTQGPPGAPAYNRGTPGPPAIPLS